MPDLNKPTGASGEGAKNLKQNDRMNKQANQQASLVLASVAAAVAVVIVVIFMWNFLASGQSNGALKENGEIGELPAGEGLSAKQKIVPPISDPEFKKFVSSITRKKADDPLAVGKIDAPVTMIQFADFSCPLCYQWENQTHPKIQKLIDNGTLRLEFHPFVIFQEKYNSMLGARAAEAAGKQGKFWNFLKNSAIYAEKLVEKGENAHIVWSDDLAKKIAAESGVSDLQKFEKDYRDPEVEKQIVAQMRPVMQAGIVSGTPGFIINDRLVAGAYPADVFLATIDAAAKDQKK